MVFGIFLMFIMDVLGFLHSQVKRESVDTRRDNCTRKSNMILILVAVREELSEKDLPDMQIHYTGVGKINAAIKTLKIIKDYSPSLIVNYGTVISVMTQSKYCIGVDTTS